MSYKLVAIKNNKMSTTSIKHNLYVLNPMLLAYLQSRSKYIIWRLREKIKAKYLYLAKYKLSVNDVPLTL